MGRPHSRDVSPGPFVGRVDADLAAESRDRRREVEIVDRRVRHDQRVARRVDARGQRPDHFLPFADVHVVVGDDDHLRVHELTQEAPDAEHHALGVPGVLLFHRHDGEPIAAAFRRQVEVGDLRILLLQERHEHLVQRHAEHRRLVRRLAGVGRVIDRIAPQRDALDRQHRKALDLVVVAGVVAERALRRRLVAGRVVRIGLDEAFEHDLRRRRHLQVVRAGTSRSRCGRRAAGRRTGTRTASPARA